MVPRDVFQADAIYRAHRNTQLAAGAPRSNHGVHQFVAAENGIRRADIQAQCAANAPGLVNHGHGAWAFTAMDRVQRQRW